MTLTATWAHDQRALLTTVEELDALLDRLARDARAADRPQDVQLTAHGGAGTLGIVFGHDRSFLNHIPANGDPPYLTSLGEQDAQRPFTFYVAGDHHSESAWRNTVPAHAARQAAREFLLTGALDPRVRWHTD